MREFKSTSVSYHYDSQKDIYQIYLTYPYKWLTRVKTKEEAKEIVKLVDSLIALPNGPQIVKHLNVNIL